MDMKRLLTDVVATLPRGWMARIEPAWPDESVEENDIPYERALVICNMD
jgi:hypothetical protein